eukprot:5718003-Amphidinium_carterae.1
MFRSMRQHDLDNQGTTFINRARHDAYEAAEIASEFLVGHSRELHWSCKLLEFASSACRFHELVASHKLSGRQGALTS